MRSSNDPRRQTAVRRLLVGLTACIAVLATAPISSPAATVTGVVGPYQFSTARITGQAGKCTYATGVLSSITVTPPLAQMRSYWSSRFVNQYVEFLAQLYGQRSDGTWVSLGGAGLRWAYQSVKSGSWTRMPALSAFTPANGIAPGYGAYRVSETLKWLRPTNSSVEGSASLVLGSYWDGRQWLSTCPRPPAPVTSVHAANVSDSAITLGWTKPASSYHGIVVRYAVSPTVPSSPTSGTAARWSVTDPTTAVALGLKPNTTYTFAVWSVDTLGHYSARATASIKTKPLPPVSGLAAPATTVPVHITWAPVTSPNVTGIRLCRGTTAPTSPTCASPVDLPNTATGYADASSQPGHTYGYTVWTHDAHPTYSAPKSITVSTTPGPITALSATATPSQVTLTWTTPVEPNITGIALCRAPAFTTGCLDLPATQSQYVDTSVQPATGYSYALTTHDTATSSTAQTIAVSTPASPVTGLTVVAQPDGVHLSWTNSVDPAASGVTICRATGSVPPTDPSSCLVQVPLPATSYADTTANPGTTYSYAVFAADGSVFSAPQTATVDTIPSAVTAFAASMVATGVQLTWSNPPDPNFNGVKICRTIPGSTPDPTPDPTTCTSLPGPLTSPYIDSSAQSGTTYTYFVWAHDSTPLYSPAAQARISTAPGPVQGLTATATATQVQLTWTNPSDPNLTGVRVCRADGSTPPADPSATCTQLVDPATSPLIDSAVQPGTTYSYSVWTYDGTTYSPAAAVTIGTTPDAVQGLAAAPSAGQVQLSWTNPAADDDVTGVRVCRADGTTPPPDPNGCAPLTDALVSSYADTTVQPGSVYSYSVWTHNAQQTYSGATTATVTTPANPVTALTLVSQADGVHLAWTNPADATLTGVEICRADGATAPSDPASCLVITDTTAGSYVDASAHTGTTYSYALFAHDGSVFATPASATISTVPGAVTGVARPASAPSQVTLTWTNPTDPNVTGVKICRSPPTTAPTDPTCSALADTNAGTFTDTNVHPGSVYTYTLFAHDAVPQYGPAATITVTA